ncbi:MAG: exosortase/archaeosortase family protein [Anaerolineae bacterium]
MSRNPRRLAGITAVIALVGVVFLPTLRWLVQSWLGNPYYSHGFLVPFIAGYLIWRRRDVVVEPWDAGLGVVALGVGLQIASMPWQWHLLSAASLIVVIMGLLLTFVGRRAVKRWAFPLAFLVMMIPLPFVERFSPPLEAFVARYAALGVRPLGVAATTIGSQVRLASASFTVGAPCSGLRSIVALLTLTVLFIYIVRGPWWGKGALLVAALPIAVVANLMRVSSLFFVAENLGTDAGLRYYHTLSSPTLFLVAVGLLLLTSRSVQCHAIRSDI